VVKKLNTIVLSRNRIETRSVMPDFPSNVNECKNMESVQNRNIELTKLNQANDVFVILTFDMSFCIHRSQVTNAIKTFLIQVYLSIFKNDNFV